ncbi:MAG: HAD hydrolase family protein, partial [Carnobacterium sp.]
IQFAGLGVAMGNATEEVKNVAQFVTKSNHENGVAYAVEKFVLNEETFSSHSNA